MFVVIPLGNDLYMNGGIIMTSRPVSQRTFTTKRLISTEESRNNRELIFIINAMSSTTQFLNKDIFMQDKNYAWIVVPGLFSAALLIVINAVLQQPLCPRGRAERTCFNFSYRCLIQAFFASFLACPRDWFFTRLKSFAPPPPAKRLQWKTAFKFSNLRRNDGGGSMKLGGPLFICNSHSALLIWVISLYINCLFSTSVDTIPQ
jgi:hypothetical protein